MRIRSLLVNPFAVTAFCCAIAAVADAQATPRKSTRKPAPAAATTPATAPAEAPPPETPQPAPVSAPEPQIVDASKSAPDSPEALTLSAWFILTDSVDPGHHAELRVQTLAALGLLGANPRSNALIRSALSDKDLDIRTAAVLAAREAKSPALVPDLRRMLDDKEPQVAYAAAAALWKLGDHSGQDILTAVAKGERGTSSTMMNGAKHTISKNFHDPSTLAKMGATQGATMLFGPFGMGMSAYDYLHKSGSNPTRVAALELLAEDHSMVVRDELLAALSDKDPGVRVGAAKGLSTYHEPVVAATIANLFADPKPPIRLTAAACYLLSSGAAAPPLPPPSPAVKPDNTPSSPQKKPLPSPRKK